MLCINLPNSDCECGNLKLGFFPPNGGTNLAVKDVINSLKFLKTVLPSFGGDTSHVTVGGQSAGASMIRALLATPSASSYFRSAIIQSDTMVCSISLSLYYISDSLAGLRVPVQRLTANPAELLQHFASMQLH